jgi:hypothetical protein
MIDWLILSCIGLWIGGFLCGFGVRGILESTMKKRYEVKHD